MAAEFTRPFWVLAHRCNTRAAVKDAIKAHANAIEFDVCLSEDDNNEIVVMHTTPWGGPLIREGDEVVHAGLASTGATERGTELVPFLRTLGSWAADGLLSLVYFDIKFRNEAQGRELARAVQQHLLPSGVSVVYSCSSFDGLEVSMSSPSWGGTLGGIGQVRGFNTLGPGEGVMFDEEPDLSGGVDRLRRAGFRNIGFGFGTTHVPVFHEFPPIVLERLVEEAIVGRAVSGTPQFVAVWTCNDPVDMRRYLSMGVDAIMTDDVEELVVEQANPRFRRRLATISDRPFDQPPRVSLARFHSGAVTWSGTDALITAKLSSSGPTGKVLVDEQLIDASDGQIFGDRFEAGSSNSVEFFDDGVPLQIEVEVDTSGTAPAWLLDEVEVVRRGTTYRGQCGLWFEPGKPQTVLLGTEWYSFTVATGAEAGAPMGREIVFELTGSRNPPILFTLRSTQRVRGTEDGSLETRRLLFPTNTDRFVIGGHDIGDLTSLSLVNSVGPRWAVTTVQITRSMGASGASFKFSEIPAGKSQVAVANPL